MPDHTADATDELTASCLPRRSGRRGRDCPQPFVKYRGLLFEIFHADQRLVTKFAQANFHVWGMSQKKSLFTRSRRLALDYRHRVEYVARTGVTSAHVYAFSFFVSSFLVHDITLDLIKRDICLHLTRCRANVAAAAAGRARTYEKLSSEMPSARGHIDRPVGQLARRRRPVTSARRPPPAARPRPTRRRRSNCRPLRCLWSAYNWNISLITNSCKVEATRWGGVRRRRVGNEYLASSLGRPSRLFRLLNKYRNPADKFTKLDTGRAAKESPLSEAEL
ncbi:hypothetical protein EVAR_75623_1 [Eumeta japonica]|uniref:Uncharacterized protein n=1 Tax=Eumeta variegata TaxID=151549 RepID=A0A4C1TZY4_EUMVA|nr:hypothetical protein EVAR_75623_1 [Eumeta japonica]